MNAIDEKAMAAVARQNARSAKTRRSSSGSRARRCVATNATSAATPSATSVHTRRSPQPQAPIFCSAKTSRNMPAPLSAAPARSMRAGRRVRGTWATIRTTSAARPSGTLTKKIRRQLIGASQLPRIGPSAVMAPVIEKNFAIDEARPPAGTVTNSRPTAEGNMAAMPAPCTARPAINTPAAADPPGTRPQTIEPARNSAEPTITMRR